MNVVDKYRKAAIDLYGITKEEAAQCIVSGVQDDEQGGQWAPKAYCVIYLEYGYTQPISYYTNGALDNCLALEDKAGTGYIEYINAAVAAVYPT